MTIAIFDKQIRSWNYQERLTIKTLLIFIILMGKIVIPDVALEYNSLYDFLAILESFPSSSALDILSIVNSSSLKISDNIRGIIRDYDFSFERSWIYDKWEWLKFLMHSLGVGFNEQYNRFVHLFSLENVDDVEKTKIFWKSVANLQNQFLKSGDLATLIYSILIE
jgi:hypothetical protein